MIGFRVAILAMLVIGALGLSGCAHKSRVDSVRQSAPVDWHRVVTRADFRRLHGWREAFVSALNSARIAGHAAQVAREGVLLQPDSALDGVALPNGRYSCRTIKLGARNATGASFVAYPAFDCIVTDEGALTSFMKTSGSQRPVGLVFDDDARRKVFLGTMMLGDERDALDYGRDPDRDIVGAIERIGDRRWRMILPYPRFESVLDVIELVSSD